MPRKSTGAVLERATKHGVVFALRFSAYGERRYVTLGRTQDGWTRPGAEEELANVLALVRRGIWQAPEHVVSEAPPAGGPDVPRVRVGVDDRASSTG